MKHLIVWFMAILGVIGSLSSDGYGWTEEPSSVSLNAFQQIQALREEKALRTPAQKKVDSQIIYATKIVCKDPLLQSVPMLQSGVEIAPDGTTLVDIKGKVTPALLEEIEQLGGKVISSFEQYDAIRAHLLLEQIEIVAEHPDIQFVRPAAKAIQNKVNTSEGDVAHNAALARSTFGVDGTGIKVGVLSDSVDHLADVQASGDLPPVVTVLEDAPGNLGEGTAVLEIIHDLAPGAELYFATAWNGMESFADNILALRTAGCDVLLDDITYLAESPFQDDVISQAVNTVTADGALYFSPAGNGGNLNDGTSGTWEGDFSGVVDPTLPSPLDLLVVHDFGGGDVTNEIIASASESFYYLFWSDPLGGSGNDYDLYVLDPFGSIVAVSDNAQDGDDDPLEGVHGYGDLAGYQFVVAQYGAPEDRFLHLNSFGTSFLEHTTGGQIKGHHAATDAFSVAAVEAQEKITPFDGTESVEWYSGDGPRRVFYYADGTDITPGNYSSSGGEVRQKPDIAGADCVQTATPGFNPLCGTSAATPHAAGIAALLLSAQPSLTPAEARAALTSTALDIEDPGWDRDSGAGIAMADLALASIMVEVPDVAGLSQATAEAAIAYANLTVGTITEEYSHTVPLGHVISQDPASGTYLLPNSPVNLVVSLGGPPARTICSTLDDTRNPIGDRDIFEFSGQKREEVIIRLAPDPNGYSAGTYATLVLRVLKPNVAWLPDWGKWRKIDTARMALPIERTLTLPKTGEYEIWVVEQDGRGAWRSREGFVGDYCLTLESFQGAWQTFQEGRWIE